MILFCENTRRVGAIGGGISLLAGLLLFYFRWPSPFASYLWGAACLACGAFYLNLFRLQRRRVVTLQDGELVWNTSSLASPAVSVRVSEIRAYRVEVVCDTHLYLGAVITGSSTCREIGSFSLDVHRRIFAALVVLKPTLEWQLNER